MDEQEVKAIVTVCQEMGVLATGVRSRGAVLVIEPVMGAALPGADVLRELSSKLAKLGHRYVTLDLGGYAAQGGEL
ncbi:hypothetical protein FRC96_15600 [Lujinxingia vulgaris]|uniref:Uncharacterized protein n=1 Tax=Lujinxingia vulgaris TaxID=2600176 RepID=A0A5C6X4P9_9DELT|nr:hypothetical protein [Lujinxingia vulgaris]TXD33605.1 hypothetical protein FRC96_15600 [Lujinxingia vulgaris]